MPTVAITDYTFPDLERERSILSAGGFDLRSGIPADSPLCSLPNVIVASHIASASPKAVRTLRETAAKLAVTALRREPLPNVVNGVTP